ncbi:unnamed protein product [Calypogeia fissa]
MCWRSESSVEDLLITDCGTYRKPEGKFRYGSYIKASHKEAPIPGCHKEEEQEGDRRYCQVHNSHPVQSNEPADEPVKCDSNSMGVKVFSDEPLSASNANLLADTPSTSPGIIIAPPLGVDNQADYFRGSGSITKQKNVLSRVFDILKGCRPGADISSVCVPAAFNFPKSQVQLFAEQVYCCSQNLLEQCADAATPLDRFLAVLRWQISLTRPAPFLKAPYNPILGETHHVSAGELNLIAEQVSHHPPETAVYATNTKKGIQFFQSCKPSPRFWGNSLEVTLLGRQCLVLAEHGEMYDMTPPKLTFRFLPVSCSEWTGVTTLRCAVTGLEATVSYKARSLLRGVCNKINGTIQSTSSGKVLHTLTGQWDKTVFLEDTETGSKTVFYDGNVALSNLKCPEIKNEQALSPMESVNVWSKVTERLWREDWDGSREAKFSVEENQRTLRKKRSQAGETWQPKYFTKTVHEEWEWALKGQPVPQGPIECEGLKIH